MFWLCMTNGAAGHTYGANGIWQCNRPGQPHGPSPHGGDYGHIPWNEAMNLPGSRQVGLGKKLFEKYEWQKFEPHPEWVQNPADVRQEPASGKPAAKDIGPFAVGIPGNVRIVYSLPRIENSTSPRRVAVRRLEPDVKYRAKRLTPRTARRRIYRRPISSDPTTTATLRIRRPARTTIGCSFWSAWINSHQLPALVDPLVAKIFRNRLPRDVADRVVAERGLVELEPPEIRAEEHDAAGRDVRGQPLQQLRVVALHVPVVLQPFRVGKCRRIDHGQIPLVARREALQELSNVAAHEPMLRADEVVELQILARPIDVRGRFVDGRRRRRAARRGVHGERRRCSRTGSGTACRRPPREPSAA